MSRSNTKDTVSMDNPQGHALEQIEDKRMTLDDVAVSYAYAIRQQETHRIAMVNRAIIERWSESGLKYVKDKAWRMAGEMDRAELRERRAGNAKEFPYVDGDTIVLGPQVFVAKDGSVLNWRGVNYYPTTSWKRIETAVRLGAGAGSNAIMQRVQDVVMPAEEIIEACEEIIKMVKSGEPL